MKQGRAEIRYAKQCDNYDLISFISKTIFEIKYQENKIVVLRRLFLVLSTNMTIETYFEREFFLELEFT